MTRRVPSRAALREAQGRLFWVWLLTSPIVFLEMAHVAFGAPWPGPLLKDVGLLLLAFPVLFVVGDRTFHAARARLRAGEGNASAAEGADEDRDRGSLADLVVAAACVVAYGSGFLATFTYLPNPAGFAAVLMAAHTTVRYLREHGGRAAR